MLNGFGYLSKDNSKNEVSDQTYTHNNMDTLVVWNSNAT